MNAIEPWLLGISFPQFIGGIMVACWAGALVLVHRGGYREGFEDGRRSAEDSREN